MSLFPFMSVFHHHMENWPVCSPFTLFRIDCGDPAELQQRRFRFPSLEAKLTNEAHWGCWQEKTSSSLAPTVVTLLEGDVIPFFKTVFPM